MSAGFEPVNITPQKQDPAWKHVQMFKNEDRVQLKCIYCGKIFKGGGIHRIKEHLAGQKGNASTCPRVVPEVRLVMQQSLNGVIAKKRKKQKISDEISGGAEDQPQPLQQVSLDVVDSFGNTKCDDVDVQLIANPDVLEPTTTLIVGEEEGGGGMTASGGGKGVEKRKRGRPSKKQQVMNSRNQFMFHRGTELVGLDSRSTTNYEAYMAIGRFFYDVGLPPDAVNSVYFQPMVDAIASQGLGFVGPTYHDLRGWILKTSLVEAKSNADYNTRTWAKTGCSILVEEQSTDKGRTMVNFLVDCPEGTMFLKSVDVTDIMDSEDSMLELLKGVVEEVGAGNVLQVITNDDDRYAAIGRRLYDVYPTLYWTPCATSQLAFILDDFGNMGWINTILQQCKSITRFIYNHSFALSMMRRYTYGIDLVVPGGNPSSTSFKTLKQIVELKHNMQALVTSQEWLDSLHSKNEAGLAMLDSLSDESFWSSCNLIVRLTDPLLQLLELVDDSDRKPSMGYVYAGIYRAKETIKKELQKKDDYDVYWHFIDRWWGTHQSRPLRAAGFYLNPKYFYRIGEVVHGQIVSSVFDCIERLVPDAELQDKITKELNSYKNAAGDFGRQMAIRARETMLPDEWWSTYGGGCPNLARLAVRILSQRCSLVRLRRHLSPFEQIQQTKNSLEHQRLVDLIYTQCNLRLRHKAQNSSKEQDVMDPIGFHADYSGVEDWLGMEQYPEDCGSTDWMNIEQPPSVMIAAPKPLSDEVEEDSGFKDDEIFCGEVKLEE